MFDLFMDRPEEVLASAESATVVVAVDRLIYDKFGRKEMG